MILINAIFWGIATDIIATYRGANPNLGFLAGFLLGPIGIFIAFVLPKKGEKGKNKLCPYCGKYYQGNPNYCPNCGNKLKG